MRRSKSVLIAVGLTIALGAVAAAASQGAGALPAGRDFRGWTARDAKATHAWMYVVGFHTDAVSIYDLDAFGTPKIGSIAQGIADPSCAVLDARGNLYVCNQSGINSDVTVYQPRAKTPTLTLQGLSAPACVAVDTNGDVYVANRGSAPSIFIYAQGQTTPYASITNPLIQIPSQLQFDAARNLYFSDNSTGISEIAFGSRSPVSLGLQGLVDPSGLALDTSKQDIFVSDIAHNPNQVALYKAGATSPTRWLERSSADQLTVGRLRKSLYLFVPDTITNEVSVYRPNAARPFLEIPTDVQYLIAVAIKPSGIP
jgi:DNA-binding beta-propeller fold protein YncE